MKSIWNFKTTQYYHLPPHFLKCYKFSFFFFKYNIHTEECICECGDGLIFANTHHVTCIQIKEKERYPDGRHQPFQTPSLAFSDTRPEL